MLRSGVITGKERERGRLEVVGDESRRLGDALVERLARSAERTLHELEGLVGVDEHLRFSKEGKEVLVFRS
jgi:hypothetical protein